MRFGRGYGQNGARRRARPALTRPPDPAAAPCTEPSGPARPGARALHRSGRPRRALHRTGDIAITSDAGRAQCLRTCISSPRSRSGPHKPRSSRTYSRPPPTDKRDLTEDERKTFDSIVGRLAFLDAEIKRLTEAEAGSAKFVEIYGAHAEAEARAAQARDREQQHAPAGPPEERAKSWGTRFIESEQFKSYSGHGSSQPYKIEGEFLEERADITTAIGTPPQYWSGPRDPALRVPLFDVVGVVPTTMGSVEYYYWQPETGMASEVPENTLKPEAPIAGVLLAVPMSTYAWWKGITRQALDDVPMVRTIVDTQLRRGVIRKINAEAAVALAADANIPTHGTGAERAARVAARRPRHGR